MHLFTLLLFRRLALLSLASLLASQLTACGSRTSLNVPSTIQPYKPEVVQGNFVSREQVAALRTGMPKAQVKSILGTPLLTDIFHANRWDYVFTIEQNSKVAKSYRLTVYFNADVLERWRGDDLPSEAEFVSSLPSGRSVGKIPPLSADEKELLEFSKRENARSKQSPSENEHQLPPAGKTYPPLESQ